MLLSKQPDVVKHINAQDAFWNATKTVRRRAMENKCDRKRTNERARKSNVLVQHDTTLGARGGGDDEDDECDVLIIGGVLGAFVAHAVVTAVPTARVAVVERNESIVGRDQEWNASLDTLTKFLNALGPVHGYDDAITLRDNVTTSRWKCSRAFVEGMSEPLAVTGVMDCGVSPRRLIDAVRDSLVRHGVRIHTGTEATHVHSHRDAAVVQCRAYRRGREKDSGGGGGGGGNHGNIPTQVRARLVVDCTGHFSRFAEESRRLRSKRQPLLHRPPLASEPRGHVVVVGGCLEAPSWPQGNDVADLLACFDTVSQDDIRFGQPLWEAFPADLDVSGTTMPRRTVYMFAYIDDHPDRPSLAEYAGRFVDGLSRYQGVDGHGEEVGVVRFLAGALPCYSDIEGPHVLSEARRVLHVGDASAAHSPLSFGGFGAMIRTLPMLRPRLARLLESDRLDAGSLRRAAGGEYDPALSSSWLFNRSMSLRVGTSAARTGDCVLRTLRLTFTSLKLLQRFGIRKPADFFLADEMRPIPLMQLLLVMGVRQPLLAYSAAARAGMLVFVRWYVHYVCLCAVSVVRLISFTTSEARRDTGGLKSVVA